MEKIYHSKLEWLRVQFDKLIGAFEPYYTDYFKKYHKPLKDWFVRYGYPIADASDLANITIAQFVQLQKEGKYLEKGKQWSYLQQIAYFKHLHLRRVKNEPSYNHPSEADDEADLLEKDQQLEWMLECVAQAKQSNLETTDLFVLYYQNKTLYTIRELAAQGNISEGGLKRRFDRMRNSLKDCLQKKQMSPHGSTF